MEALMLIWFQFSFLDVVLSLGPPDIFSSWYAIEAYNSPQVDIPHGLGELPMKVEVQVKVQDTLLGDMIFLASGSVQQSADKTDYYGGVTYMYNNEVVRIMAPSAEACSAGYCNGGLVYLGGSGFNGPASGSSNGLYTTGHVRIRAWKMCSFVKPTQIMDLIYLDTTIAQQSVPLSGASKYDMILVKVNLVDGWITDALGSMSFDTANPLTNGVVYGFDGINVELIAPKAASGGHIINTQYWGDSSNSMLLNNATVRMFAWKFNADTPIKVTKIVNVNPSSNSLHFMAMESPFDPMVNDTFISIQISANDLPSEDDWNFQVAGSATTEGTDTSINYGSVFFGFNSDTIMFWTPTLPHGCSLQTVSTWGDGSRVFCSKEPMITVRYFLADFEDLPCGEKGCSGAEFGPVCDCGGSGYEGQFCSAAVKCPLLIPGVDYFFSKASYVDINGDGEVSFTDGMSFECVAGYEYSTGDVNRMCTENQTWSGEPFTCSPVPCLVVPETATFGTFNGNYTSYYGSMVSYICNTGYDWKSGDMERMCIADGTWNGTAPICDRSCGEPEAPTGAVRTNKGITEGVIADYVCKEGHEYASGDMQRECLVGGTWTGVAPVCNRVSCGQPGPGILSTLDVSGILYSDRADYTCEIGYEDDTEAGVYNMVTTRRIWCLKTKQWSRDPLSCTKVRCTLPNLDVNGHASLMTTLPGVQVQYDDEVTYACHTGYGIVHGSLHLTCLHNRSWSDQAPFCQVKRCPIPNDTSNATSVVTGLTYQHQVIVVCDSGFYIFSGDSLRHCNSDGQWEGEQPVCKRAVSVVFLDGSVSGSTTNGSPTSSNLNELKNGLIIDRQGTTKYKQSLSSRYSDRPSHIAIGCCGVAIILLVCTYICSLDFIRHVKIGGKIIITQGKLNPYKVSNKNAKNKKTNKPEEKKEAEEEVEHIYA